MVDPVLNELPPPPSGKTGWPWNSAGAKTQPEAFDRTLWPRISIVTPSFNQGRYIEATIRSVLMQGYPNLEYIIMDGGSSDNSVEIIKKYGRWLAFWTTGKDGGQSDAINNGIRKASGTLVNWLNCDDYYLPGALKRIATAYLKSGNKECVAVAKCRWIDGNGKTLFEHVPGNVAPLSVAGCGDNWIPQPAGFFTRSAFWETGGLELDLHHAMDFDMYVKLSKKVPFIRIEECIAVALSHESAKTEAQREKMFAEVRIIQFRNGYESLARQGLEKDYGRLLKFDKLTAPLRNNAVYRLAKKAVTRARK